MKKIIILIFVLVSAQYLSLSYDHCPTGYTPDSFNDTYEYIVYDNQGNPTVFQCNFNIGYCCKWDNDNKVVKVIIDYIYVTGYDATCFVWIPDYSDLNNWLHDRISERANELCTPIYPSCDDEENNYYILEIGSASCYKYVRIQPYTGDDVWITRMESCSQTIGCMTTWKICLDYNFSPPKLTREFVSKEVHDPYPQCSSNIPELPPVGKTWDESWETECFHIDCQ